MEPLSQPWFLPKGQQKSPLSLPLNSRGFQVLPVLFEVVPCLPPPRSGEHPSPWQGTGPSSAASAHTRHTCRFSRVSDAGSLRHPRRPRLAPAGTSPVRSAWSFPVTVSVFPSKTPLDCRAVDVCVFGQDVDKHDERQVAVVVLVSFGRDRSPATDLHVSCVRSICCFHEGSPFIEPNKIKRVLLDVRGDA